jgi:nicotinate-nucleotide adenylyltransferase
VIPPRIAVLGGTFDPFHLGHLAVAEQARDALGAGEAWIVPAAIPPLRPAPAASFASRLEMARAGTAGRDGLRVLDLEAGRPPAVSFTVDTMRDLARRHPDAELWTVLGADAARSIGRWERAAELLAEQRFALVNRAGEERIAQPEAVALGFAPDRSRLIEIVSPGVSATLVRERVGRGEPVDDLTGPAVAGLIAASELYLEAPGGHAIMARE